MPAEWKTALTALLHAPERKGLQLAGIGNPIRSDDGVGLYILSRLKRHKRSKQIRDLDLLPVDRRPEYLFAHLSPQNGGVLIFDAVECNQEPGSVIFAGLDETKYGFFVTHNLPLKLMLRLQSIQKKAFIVGIQPENTEIGEKLTGTVKAAADRVVETIVETMEGE